ncbi:MAG: Ig-like domain-containing protein, partial [Bifidobacteriaceae bacterium]|nr:Ig-like domain-containing protein [Bifidobacteriaceae bacterium]
GKTDPSDAGNTVQVVDPGTGEVLCETTVKADGTFECDGLNPKPDDGAEIQVVVTDPANNPSDPATVVIDGTAPDKPVLEPSDGSAVYGTAEPGSTVKVTDEDGNVVCETTADKATGSFACVPDKPMDDGEEFDVTATDAAGNESDPAHGRVDQSEVPEPTVDPTNGSEVTGTGIPGAKVTVTLPDGSEYETTVDPDGKWSVTPPDTYVPKDGDEVEVTQEVPFNRDGDKTSKPVVVPLDTVAPPAPSPAPSDGATLSGTEKVDEAGDMVTVKDPNGAVIGTALVDPDGSWTAALAPHAKEGDQLSITVTDPAGNVSAAKKWRVGLLKVTVGSTSVVAGGQQTVQVENLQPGEAATLTLMPDGVKLEPVAGDANGSATLKFTVRTDASTTVQHLVQAVGPLSGTANSGYFTVTAPAPVPYQVQVTPTVTTTAAARHVVQTPTVAVHPATGAEGLMGAVGAGLGLLLAGLLLLLAARRRRRDEQEV